MLDTLETVFYIFILLLLLSTFLPKPVRRQVRAVLVDFGRFLWHFTIHVAEPVAYRLVTGLDPDKRDAGPARRPLQVSIDDTNESDDDRTGTEPFAVENDVPAHTEEDEQEAANVRAFAGLLLTNAEVAAIGRAIVHNRTAEKPTKSSTIQAGWGLKRGGGTGYQRASEIYDAIFDPQPEAKYPTIQQQRERIAAESNRP